MQGCLQCAQVIVDEPVPSYPKHPVAHTEDTAMALKRLTRANSSRFARSGSSTCMQPLAPLSLPRRIGHRISLTMRFSGSCWRSTVEGGDRSAEFRDFRNQANTVTLGNR